MAGVIQTAGSKIFIGTATAVLSAETDWAEIGEVTNLGDFGRKYDVVKFSPLGSRGVQKFKGSYDDGALKLTVGRVPSDDGQARALTARDLDASYNFKIELADIPVGGSTPTTFLFGAKVMSYTTKIGATNKVVEADIDVEIDAGTIVETAAA